MAEKRLTLMSGASTSQSVERRLSAHLNYFRIAEVYRPGIFWTREI